MPNPDTHQQRNASNREADRRRNTMANYIILILLVLAAIVGIVAVMQPDTDRPQVGAITGEQQRYGTPAGEGEPPVSTNTQ